MYDGVKAMIEAEKALRPKPAQEEAEEHHEATPGKIEEHHEATPAKTEEHHEATPLEEEEHHEAPAKTEDEAEWCYNGYSPIFIFA